MLQSKAPEKAILEGYTKATEKTILQEGYMYAPEKTILVDGKADSS